MIVKHKFAGWVGVVRNGVCANGTVEFLTGMFGTSQLIEHIPTTKEKEILIDAMKENQPHLSGHIREAMYAEEIRETLKVTV